VIYFYPQKHTKPPKIVRRQRGALRPYFEDH